MRTFTESLQITTNIKMLRESFILMSERGINPNDFVEWYTTDGIGAQDQGLLTEASEEWLEGRVADWIRDYAGQKGLGRMTNALGTAMGSVVGGGIDAAKGLAGATYDNAQAAGKSFDNMFKTSSGQNSQQPVAPHQEPEQAHEPEQSQESPYHVKNAANAIDSLSKRMSRSKSLMGRLGGVSFQAAVVNLLNMLRNPSNLFQSNDSPNSAVESTGFGEFTRKIRLRNEIKTGLRTLQKFNIDPVKFVDWYIEEGQYLNEGMFDGVKDWFGRQWANAKGAWNQWGKAGNEYQIQKDKQRDNEAIQQAMKALSELEQGMGGNQPSEDFASVLKQVQDQLTKALHEPEPEAQPEQPEDSQAEKGQPDDLQPEPRFPSGGQFPSVDDVKADIDKNGATFRDDKPEDHEWKSDLNMRYIDPDDDISVQHAMKMFNSLPEDQKREIDLNARRLWVRKGKPSQDQRGMDQDKAKAMQMMALKQDHEFGGMASEGLSRMPAFSEYLKLRS